MNEQGRSRSTFLGQVFRLTGQNLEVWQVKKILSSVDLFRLSDLPGRNRAPRLTQLGSGKAPPKPLPVAELPVRFMCICEASSSSHESIGSPSTI